MVAYLASLFPLSYLCVFARDFSFFLRFLRLFAAIEGIVICHSDAPASLANRALPQGQPAHRTFRNRSEIDPVAGT